MTTLPFKAVVFDLDGTLADSLGDIGGALNDVLQARGFPVHSMDAYRYMIGEGVETLVGKALPADQQHLLSTVLAEYRERYAVRYAHSSRPYEGIAEMLDALTARKVKLSVLSNKRDDFTSAMVHDLFGRWPFVEVRGERPGVPRKPDPTAALEIAAVMGVSAAECAFVGDTKIDMLTGVAAGMLPVGVLWGFRDRQELLAHGARALLAHPRELLTLPLALAGNSALRAG